MSKKPHCYYLEFEDPRRDFHLTIRDRATGASACPRPSVPDWARLTCYQCSCCRLSRESSEYCPAAYDMVDLVEHFSSSDSIDRVYLHMWTNGEMHTIRTDLQRALAYLYPAILAGSSCPFAVSLAPMTQFGKPFPDIVDILFYALSFRLVGSYLGDHAHGVEDTALASGRALAVAQVFHGLLRRIRQATLSDANVNALVKDIQWSYVTQYPEMFFREHLEKYFSGS